MFKANVRMYPLLTTFGELKNTIFLLVFLKDTINKTLSSTKDFMFFLWNFCFNLKKYHASGPTKWKIKLIWPNSNIYWNIFFQAKCCLGHKCCMGQSCCKGKCCMRQSFIQFLWGTDWVHNQNMCLLDWVSTLIRKYKLSFSFKAATPCSMNKCL